MTVAGKPPPWPCGGLAYCGTSGMGAAHIRQTLEPGLLLAPQFGQMIIFDKLPFRYRPDYTQRQWLEKVAKCLGSPGLLPRAASQSKKIPRAGFLSISPGG